MWKICQVRGGGIWLMILTILYLLYQNIMVEQNFKASWNIMILLVKLQNNQ